MKPIFTEEEQKIKDYYSWQAGVGLVFGGTGALFEEEDGNVKPLFFIDFEIPNPNKIPESLGVN